VTAGEEIGGKNPLQRNAILIVVATALVAQIAGTYFFRWKTDDGFSISWVILRIALPLLVIPLVGIPYSRLGLGLPRMDTRLWKFLGITVLVGAILFAGLYFYSPYYEAYSGKFTQNGTGITSRLRRFLLFSFSTIPAWEFLHRGFLLLGLHYVLTLREAVPERVARHICIALVCAFEVLFHFIKKDSFVEPVSLLAGSPILSWIALRTGSLWIPLVLHLLVEFCFIASALLR
jgi:membrane protease YdiL (CAAX protease family)